MSLINVEALSLGYGATPVFENVGFSINAGDRLGLVGANGSGKSSLLKCLSALCEDHGGSITRKKSLKTYHVHQGLLAPSHGRETCTGFLSHYLADPGEEWKVSYTFELLAFPKQYRDLRIDELSGGWNKILMFAAAIMSEPDLLIMDEPTNHLDMYRTEILVNALRFAGHINTFVVASHDRYFLDAVTQQTLFLDRQGTYRFPHAYTQAKVLMKEKQHALETEVLHKRSEVERLTESARFQRQLGVNNFSDKASQKAKQIEKKIRGLKNSLEARPAMAVGQIKLETESTEARHLLKLRGFCVCAPSGELLFTIPELEVKRGDRIVVTGANGSGKSTFLRAIAGLSGHAAQLTPSARIGYFEQDSSQHPAARSILDFVMENAEPDASRAVAVLAQAGFDYSDAKKAMQRTSFGERARLSLLALRLGRPNFLILDEPTNHLDIRSQEMLEDEIQRTHAAALIVSHDRRFVENVGTRFYSIKNGLLVEGAFHGE